MPISSRRSLTLVLSTLALVFALGFAFAAPGASAASVTEIGEGFPVSMNGSDHVLLARLGYREEEEEDEETLEAPWSIWSGGKSIRLEPLNGEPNGEPESISHEHKLELYNINEAGYVGGSSTVVNEEGGETKSLQRAVSVTPNGEIHEVPLLQEEIEIEPEEGELESRHVGSFGDGIDNAGDIVGLGVGEAEVEGKPTAVPRGFFDAGGTTSPPEVVGEADKPATGQWQSEVFEVNGSGTMFGDVTPVNEDGEAEEPTYYLWKSPSEAGTRLNFDAPVQGLASDGSVLGERGGTVYLREPSGKETAVLKLEKPSAVNAAHQVVGSETVSGAEHAAVWQAGTVTDLNTLLPAKSGWVLQRATAINDQGDIAGIGTHEGKAVAFLFKPARTAAVSPNCAQTATANIFECTVTVSDASGQPQLVVPTGAVALGVSIGSFEPLSGRCTLTAALTPGSASCTLAYKGPNAGESPGGAMITAVYEGDDEFATQTGTTTLCTPKLASVEAAKPGPFGAHPGEKATITGSGLCTGDVVSFGNEKATAALAHEAIAVNGDSATVKIPRLATTGKLSVTLGSTTVSLSSPFTIDSYRNTEGFQFNNFRHLTNYAELTEAFGQAETYETTTVDPCQPTSSCPTKTLTPIPALKHLDETYFRENLEAGVCFGFALASRQLATGRVSPASFDPNAEDAFQLASSGGPGPALESLLVTRMLMQFSDQYAAATRAQYHEANRTVANFVVEVSGYLQEGEQPLIGIVYEKKTADGKITTEGHQVIATGVEASSEEPDTYIIETVDSNTPYVPGEYSEEGASGEVHQARATYILVKGNEWSYPDRGWSGSDANLLVDVPISVLNGPLTLKHWYRRANQVSAVSGTATELVSIENGDGDTLAPGEAGISADPPATAAGPVSNASFTAPYGAYSDTIATAGSSTSQTWTGVEGILGAEGKDKKATIGIEPKSFQIAYTPDAKDGSGATKLTLVSEPAKGTTRTASVEASSAGASVTAAMGTKRNELTISSSASTKLTITLEQNTGPDALVEQHLTLTLPAGGTARLLPGAWRGKASNAVMVTIKPKHGRARRLHVKARASVPRSPVKVLDVKQRRTGKHVKLSMKLHTPKLPAGSTESVTALVTLGHRHPHSYTLLHSRVAVSGTRKLALQLPPADKRAKVQIVVLSVSSKTGGLSTRKTRLKIGR